MFSAHFYKATDVMGYIIKKEVDARIHLFRLLGFYWPLSGFIEPLFSD